MQLSTTELSFAAEMASGDPAPLSVTVLDPSGGALVEPTVSIAYDPASGSGWLSSSVAGSGSRYRVELQARVAGLSLGSHAAWVAIRSEGAADSPQVVAVSLTTTPGPIIALSGQRLAFSAAAGDPDPAPSAVAATNAGTGALAPPSAQVAYLTGSGWLEVTASASGPPYAVEVQPRLAGLAGGTYDATVAVACPGAANTPQILDVTLTVTQPILAVAPEAVAFSAPLGGPSPAPQAVTVSNAGTGTLAPPVASIAYASGSGWLSAAVSGAQAPYTVALQPGTASLAAGTYAAAVSIASARAGGSPRTVAVTLVVGQPAIGLEPASLAFSATQGGPNPAPRTVTVSNAGGATLAPPTAAISYSKGSGLGWLAATVSGAQAPYAVTLQPVTAGLSAGTYAATASIASAGASNSPQAVAVTLTVARAGLALSTTALSFAAAAGGGDPPAQVVTATNSGTGNLPRPTASIAYASGSGWLRASVSNGKAPFAISVQPAVAGLAPGSYAATLTIASAGAASSPQAVAVTLAVP
jgi:hypothetical protein